MNYNEIPIIYNQVDHKFEFIVNSQRSFIGFKQKGNTVYLIHTEVPPELQGQGIAAIMVEKTLAYLEEHQLKLVPLCSYVQVFLTRHPEWKRLEK